MTLADEARALELAELARHFYLWLQQPLEGEQKKVRDRSGLENLTPGQFHMHAGVYRKLPKSFLPNIVQFWDDREEERWLRGYNRGVEYVLLVSNPEEGVISPRSKLIKSDADEKGEYFELHENEVYLPPGGDLEQRDSIKIAFPVLDSRVPDVKTLGVLRYHTFAGFFDRADLVWDDLDEAVRLGFQSRYHWIFDYEAPREEFRKVLGDIIPPYAGVDAKQFHSYLYRYATYTERTRGEAGGQYYAKWLADEPRDPKDRELRPTKLTGDYIKDNFQEWVLQKNEAYILVSSPVRQALYRLRLTPGTGPKRFELDVHEVLRLHGRNGKAFRERAQIKPPVDAVIFFAIDGARELPPQMRARNRIELSGGDSGRYAFDYKAAVRWFFADQTTKHVTSNEDEVWFDIFVDTFFSDPVYAIDGTLPNVQTSTFSAEQLAKLADDPTGTIRQYLDQNVTSHARASNLRYVVKGWMYGESEANRRQLIGVSSSGFVYEWYVETSLVTRMPVQAWLNANDRDRIFADVYESTKGVIPFAMAVSIGGALVAGSAIAGFAILGQVARTAVRKLVTETAVKQITKQATKELLRQLRPQLVAVVAEGAMALVPARTNARDARFEFLRGFVHGFGSGAIEHWFEQLDERFDRAVTKLYKSAINKATGGVYRAHQIYLKLSAAYHHMTAALRALRKVWTNARARALARALDLLGHRAGLAFLILLFLAIYVDQARADFDKTKRDHWVKQQRDLLQLMITETAADIAVNAEQLRNDLQGTPPKSDVWRERNERIARKLASSFAPDPGQQRKFPPIVTDVLKEILAELGIKRWDELQNLGLLDVLAHGFDAFFQARPELEADAARLLGETTGELVGTLFLERALLNGAWRKRFASSKPLDHAFQRTMAGGSARALGEFVRSSVAGLRQIAKKAVGPQSPNAPSLPITFERVSKPDRSYGEIVASLVSTERELGESMNVLAANPALADRIRAVHERALGELPPDVGSWSADPAGWPPDAMQFLIESWMRAGVHLLLAAFAELEDATPYDGEFRLAQLISWLGLDVSLDDATLQALRVKFEKPGSNLSKRFQHAVGAHGGSNGGA